MADVLRKMPVGFANASAPAGVMVKRYLDMGDGTWAEVIALGAGPGVVIGAIASVSAAGIARGGAIAAGGTSQTAMAANAARKGFTIQNPTSAAEQGIAAAENLYVNLTGAAVVGGSTNLAVLPPGSAFSMGITSGLVSPEAITVIAATTGHQFYAKEF